MQSSPVSRNSIPLRSKYEGASKNLRIGRLERGQQMVQLSATMYSCIAIVSQYSEFCPHNPLCHFSMSVYYCCLFHYDSVRKLLDIPSYVYNMYVRMYICESKQYDCYSVIRFVTAPNETREM
jgi:hypothetical protein